MLRPVHLFVSMVILAGGCPPPGLAQTPQFAREIQARGRVFPEIGPGVSALKRDTRGRYYILTAPANTVAIYGRDGHRIGQIPNSQSGERKIAYASDIDLDTDGRLFVADRGSNTVEIFGSDGSLLLTQPVARPMSIAALPGLEFAVTLLDSDHLVSVFGAQGKLARSFGEEPGNPTGHTLLSPGRVYGDQGGQIYFVFTDLPTIRRYDRFGYAAYEISLAASEFRPVPKPRQWTTVTLGNDQPSLPAPVIRALAVDAEREEVWAAIGSELVHFDKDGNRRAAYLTSTNKGLRIEAAALLVEHDRILIADDPNGIFDFALPEEPSSTPLQH
jgi:hypothetical protein